MDIKIGEKYNNENANAVFAVILREDDDFDVMQFSDKSKCSNDDVVDVRLSAIAAIVAAFRQDGYSDESIRRVINTALEVQL